MYTECFILPPIEILIFSIITYSQIQANLERYDFLIKYIILDIWNVIHFKKQSKNQKSYQTFSYRYTKHPNRKVLASDDNCGKTILSDKVIGVKWYSGCTNCFVSSTTVWQ